MRPLCIKYDINYGMDNRTGWSISYNYVCVAELERFFVVAVVKAMRKAIRWEIWDRKERRLEQTATPSPQTDEAK